MSELNQLNRKIFHTNDLAVLWKITNRHNLYMTITRYIDRGVLFPIYKGMYATVSPASLNPLELGQAVIHRYTYLTTESVLAQAGIISQLVYDYTFVADLSKRVSVGTWSFRYRKLKDIYLHNPAGIVDHSGVFIATAERAVADLLYFNPKYHFDVPESIDFEKVKLIQQEVGYPPVKLFNVQCHGISRFSMLVGNADRLTTTHRKQLLLQRLDEIGASLARSSGALALIGLGSVGLEQERLDAYSDLDFFVIVETGCKAAFLDDLSWLSAIHPVAYRFKNTADGYKLLFADDIFCEFAIFEPHELQAVPFAAGRIVWKAPGVSDDIGIPARPPGAQAPAALEWLLGEALTCLYVGMGRYRRGEKLSAQRFIQHYAVDRLLELSSRVESEAPALRDAFAPERRYEQRFPQTARLLPQFVQGYAAIPQSALAILDFLDRHFEVDAALKTKIRQLCLPE